MNKGKIGAIISGVLVIGIAVAFFSTTEKIKNGNVGVVYSLNGGVQNEVLSQGLRYVGIGNKVIQYSVRTNQFYLSKESKEGSKDDDSLSVGTQGGTVNVDFEMSYSFDPEQVANIYKKYGGLSGGDIVDTIVRGRIRSLVNEITSQYTVAEVYVDKRAEVNTKITEHLRENFKDVGLNIERCSLSDVRPNESVLNALTERSKVAQELENEKQKQEKVKLEAETSKIAAQGEADAKLIKAQGEARANEELQKSITQEMVEYKKIEKWDGKLPTVSGSEAIIDMRDSKTTEPTE